MDAITLANKLISKGRMIIFSVLIGLPLTANAEYYLVYGPPEVPAVCDACASPRIYHRPVHKVYKVKKHTCKVKKYYYRPRKQSHYSITVYYPVPVMYAPIPSACCGGFLEPTYYWAPAPYRVYYTHPDDRLVGNRYGDNYYDPSLDTDTADGDIQ